jgi:hypothetical protein
VACKAPFCTKWGLFADCFRKLFFIEIPMAENDESPLGTLSAEHDDQANSWIMRASAQVKLVDAIWVGDGPLLQSILFEYRALKVINNTADTGGLSLLHLAMVSNCSQDSDPHEENRLQIVRRLLEMGADPNIQDDDGKTPLHYAVHGKPPHLRVVQLLIDHGAVVDAIDYYGETPLFML